MELQLSQPDLGANQHLLAKDVLENTLLSI